MPDRSSPRGRGVGTLKTVAELPSTIRSWGPGQSILLALTFMDTVVRGLGRFIVPLYALRLGIGTMTIGLVVAIPDALQTLLRIPGGALAQYLGEQRLIITSFALVTAAGVLFMSSSGVVGLVAAQVLVGIAVAAFVPARWSYVVTAPDLIRPQIISVTLVVLTVGTLLSPLVAGLVMGALGHRVGFGIYGAIGLVALLLAVQLLSPPPRGDPAESLTVMTRSFHDAWWSLHRHKGLTLATTCNLLLAVSRGVQIAYYPIYVTQAGISPILLGVLFTVQGVASLLVQLGYAGLVRRVAPTVPLLAGTATVGLALAATPLLRSPLALGIDMALAGLGEGLASPASTQMAAEHSTPQHRGQAMGVWSTAWSLGLVAGPVVFGPVAQWFNVGIAIAAANSVVVAGALGLGIARGRQEPPIRREAADRHAHGPGSESGP